MVSKHGKEELIPLIIPNCFFDYSQLFPVIPIMLIIELYYYWSRSNGHSLGNERAIVCRGPEESEKTIAIYYFALVSKSGQAMERKHDVLLSTLVCPAIRNNQNDQNKCDNQYNWQSELK